MNIKVNDLVKVKRDIRRFLPGDYSQPVLYSPKDTIGKVIEVFKVCQGKGRTITWHVKFMIVTLSNQKILRADGSEFFQVKINSRDKQIYTLRLTSVEKVL